MRYVRFIRFIRFYIGKLLEQLWFSWNLLAISTYSFVFSTKGHVGFAILTDWVRVGCAKGNATNSAYKNKSLLSRLSCYRSHLSNFFFPVNTVSGVPLALLLEVMHGKSQWKLQRDNYRSAVCLKRTSTAMWTFPHALICYGTIISSQMQNGCILHHLTVLWHLSVVAVIELHSLS